MAAGTVHAVGSATLTSSAPGVKASVTVSAPTTVSTDVVLITPTSAITDGRDGFGAHTFHVENITTNAFNIVSDRNELKESVTFKFLTISTV